MAPNAPAEVQHLDALAGREVAETVRMLCSMNYVKTNRYSVTLTQTMIHE